jgi:integrase
LKVASVFKPKGSTKYVIFYTDENGRRRKKVGTTDKVVSERIAHELENRAALRREGLVDPQAEAYRDHEARSLRDHVADWRECLIAEGNTLKHVDQAANRVRRLVAVMLGLDVAWLDHRRLRTCDRGQIADKIDVAIKPARLSLLRKDKVQRALGHLRDAGLSLQSCNHYRASIRAFSRWCDDRGRIRKDDLRSLKGYNAKDDRRHDRRTISLDELRRLVDAAQHGPDYRRGTGPPLTGPQRALCYRLAVATGLRFSEVASITPESFDWDAPSVTVLACYAKDGETFTFPLQKDLATDLASYVATLQPGTQVFPLPPKKGAKMLRRDLKAAGIPYRDAAGLVFDFHSLRCETATLADAAGVSPRTVQTLMRHSTLELTGRYTRPRAIDIEDAANQIPDAKPVPAATIATRTGTDNTSMHPISATTANAYECKSKGDKGFASVRSRSIRPTPRSDPAT